MKNKVISLFLALVMALVCIPFNVFAISNPTADISVENVFAAIGDTVDVNVTIADNPGIIGATLTVSYHEDLVLVGASSGDAFSALDFTKPGAFKSPCNFTWDSENIGANKDGVILTLTFQVSEEAQKNAKLNVDVSYRFGDVFNDTNDIELNITNGRVDVLDYKPGDVFEDGVLNMKDVRTIRQYIAGGYDVTINGASADVNGDGVINAKDTRMLRRHIVGGYADAERLLPSPLRCKHPEMQTVEEKAATCTEDGNITYWYCADCGRYFRDAEAKTEITYDDTVIAETGHNVVVDPAVAPSYTQTGLTEGSHCSVCKMVIVAQTVLPVIKGYSIDYRIYDSATSDDYIKNYVVNNPIDIPANEWQYHTEEGLELPIIEIPGYKFIGWSESRSSADNILTRITAGTTGNKTLYAHWEASVYAITYASDMYPITGEKYEKYKTYTTGVGHESLPNPQMDKYTFIGWSDKDGNMWDSVPKGTTDNITLYANWASNRNKAVAVDNLADPIIAEDSDKGLILFTYEIGKIERVPLFEILKLNCANGIITSTSRTEETSFGNQYAESAVEAIADATTNSASWTLEENWNSSTEVSKTTLDQTGLDETTATKLSQSQTGTFNVGTSYGGSKSYTNTESGSFTLSANKSHSTTNTTETGQEFGLSVDGKYSRENSVGLNLGIPIEGVDLGIQAGRKSSWEIGAGVDYKNYVKNTTSGTDSWSIDAEISKEKSASVTNEKTWNTEVGFSNSQTTSIDEEVSKTISKLISEELGYGESYAEGGSNSSARAQETASTKSNEFSSTLTYHTSEIKTTTTTYTSTGNTIGDYRLVMTGTIRVFAVVGYNIAEGTYFVYTYNVMDENAKTEEYLDYSYDGTFDDYQTSIIPFEVPVFVNEYVNNRIAETDGLTHFNYTTGKYGAYSGDSTIVSVPSYHVRDNDDGTTTAYKVNGIDSNVFSGNTEIVGVVLGHHITEIPDNAFEGCTSLQYVICPGVTKIGDNAFKGCTSLKTFTIPYIATEWQCSNTSCAEIVEQIDCPEKCARCGQKQMYRLDNGITIGKDAFLEVPKIEAKVTSVELAEAVAASGAQNIVLNISYIPKTQSDNMSLVVGNINTFDLRGEGDTFKGLTLQSDAANTILNRVNITEATGAALNLSSTTVTLNGVNMSIEATGCAMMLKAEHTNVVLRDVIHLSSGNNKTVICKSVTFSPMTQNDIAKMIVGGNVLICDAEDDISGKEYLEADAIIPITATEFSKYEQGVVNITLNANGGVVSTTSKEVYYGDVIGELPTPTRENCTFLGWYKADGTQVTEDTVFNDLSDVTLRAYWQSDWVAADAMPENAQMLDEKWTYTLTTSEWSEYGAWSAWSKTAVTASDSRQVETQTVAATYKTQYNYSRYTQYSNGTGVNGPWKREWGSSSVQCNYYIERGWSDTALSAYDSQRAKNPNTGAYETFNCYGRSGDAWYNEVTRKVEVTPAYTQYRYRDRTLIVNTEELESATVITPTENISNVQHMVKYVIK